MTLIHLQNTMVERSFTISLCVKNASNATNAKIKSSVYIVSAGMTVINKKFVKGKYFMVKMIKLSIKIYGEST